MNTELHRAEIDDLLHAQVVGRIGCHVDGLTYVVPRRLRLRWRELLRLQRRWAEGADDARKPAGLLRGGRVRAGELRSAIVQGRYEELDGEGAERSRRGAYSPGTVRGEMAVDYFLKVDGILGESKDAKHKDEIDVLDVGWGVSQTAPGGGGGTGKAVFDDLVVVARTSKASPLLWLACASGEHIKSAVLTARRGGKGRVEFLKITLADVLVASYELDGSGGDPPLDQLALAYAKIETEYTPVDATGKGLPPVKAAWDLKAGKKA